MLVSQRVVDEMRLELTRADSAASEAGSVSVNPLHAARTAAEAAAESDSEGSFYSDSEASDSEGEGAGGGGGGGGFAVDHTRAGDAPPEGESGAAARPATRKTPRAPRPSTAFVPAHLRKAARASVVARSILADMDFGDEDDEEDLLG